MTTLRKAIRFFMFHLGQNTKYLCSYIYRYFQKKFVVDVNFLPPSSLKNILEEGKSFIRFGDGEIHLMNFGNIGYEKFEPEIRDKFFEIITNYNEKSPYVLGINEGPLLLSNSSLRKIGMLNCWLPLKVYYDLFFPKNVSYIDSSVFYYNETIPDFIESYAMKKSVVVVTRQGTIDKIKSNTRIPFDISHYITTPETNSFKVYGKLLDSIIKVVENNKSSSLVFLACGPISKMLAYELSKEGIQVVDIGLGIELMYTDQIKSGMVKPPAPYRIK